MIILCAIMRAVYIFNFKELSLFMYLANVDRVICFILVFVAFRTRITNVGAASEFFADLYITSFLVKGKGLLKRNPRLQHPKNFKISNYTCQLLRKSQNSYLLRIFLQITPSYCTRKNIFRTICLKHNVIFINYYARKFLNFNFDF